MKTAKKPILPVIEISFKEQRGRFAAVAWAVKPRRGFIHETAINYATCEQAKQVLISSLLNKEARDKIVAYHRQAEATQAELDLACANVNLETARKALETSKSIERGLRADVEGMSREADRLRATLGELRDGLAALLDQSNAAAPPELAPRDQSAADACREQITSALVVAREFLKRVPRNVPGVAFNPPPITVAGLPWPETLTADLAGLCSRLRLWIFKYARDYTGAREARQVLNLAASRFWEQEEKGRS